jgi:NitT/TauT family transport system substrate-binding protein
MHHARRHRRGAAIVAFAAAISTVVALAPAASGQSSRASLTHVTVMLDWLPRAAHAPFFVAQKMGYFKQQGLDVSVTPGKGSSTTMQLVGHGRFDFGFGDLPTLATARSQGIPDVTLVATNEKSPLAMCSLASSHPLPKPQSLKGLRMGIDPSGSTFVFYKTLLAANGMTRSDEKEFTLGQPYENYLLQNRVDVIPCYVDAELPILQAHAKGKKISVLIGSKWGYNVLGSGLLTTDSMIAKHPDTVQKFVNAYMKASRWVIGHPRQAAQIVADSSAETKGQQGIYLKQLQADIKYTFTNAVTKQHGLGYMTPGQWRATVAVLRKNKVISKSPATASLFDDSFVKKANAGA